MSKIAMYIRWLLTFALITWAALGSRLALWIVLLLFSVAVEIFVSRKEHPNA